MGRIRRFLFLIEQRADTLPTAGEDALRWQNRFDRSYTMLRESAGETVLTRQLVIVPRPESGVSTEAIFHAAMLLTSPRLLSLDPGRGAHRYAVALDGGPAVVEYDLEGFPGPEMAIRTSAAIKGEAIRLLEKLSATLTALCSAPTAEPDAKDPDDLPF
jgi:hypothetical protein